MIRRLLVANRGEIAVRILRACREMGIEGVAVYSDADAGAAHVMLADRAVPIGPAPASESYLSIQRILDAARTTGADAVHPGYGFLSQSHAFVTACEHEGLVFVGPPAPAVALMGSKIDARRTMQAAGVPVVPGETPADQSDAAIAHAIDSVGLPALIKASSGGGGKGMRRVLDRASVVAGIQAARREAQAAFGDGTLYVERLIERPHHIEVQVFADAHGHTTHLFERECSVQRRHQKVIEESPSPNVTPGLRERITSAAVRAAETCGYRNAGTVEFLVDLSNGRGDDVPFYFLEMNTRLQVEHGVTEQVTGTDLVRAQLLVASGEALPWSASTLSQRGHAIEARVYAEDPSRGFLPQAGRLLLYREPVMPGVRVDSGVREGDEVSVHYDPLLAKVIATAETRELAIARLSSALRQFPVLGIPTNISFLLRVLESPSFGGGRVHTGFLDGEGTDLALEPQVEPPDFVRALVAVADSTRNEPAALPRTTPDPWTLLSRWRV